MTLVLSVSSLVAIGRAERLAALNAVSQELLVPEEVYELLIDDAPEIPAASGFVRFGETDAFRVVPVEDAPLYERLRGNGRLADADAAAIALAELVSGVVVAEERYVGAIARAEMVPSTTVPAVLIGAVAGGDLPAPEALDAFDDLLETGWFGRPDLYAAFIRSLDVRG